MNVVELPVGDISKVSARLRDLADAIDEGHFGDAHAVAWVIDCGNGRNEVGLIGRGPGVAGADAHLMLAIGQRKLEATGML